MNEADRDRSGYEFSAQAASILNDIEFTPEGMDRFFWELKKKPIVELSRYGASFFLRGNKVCVSKQE